MPRVKTKWTVQRTGDSKWLEVKGPLNFYVDFDDVDHTEIEILTETIASTLSERFVPPLAQRCENEECEESWVIRRLGSSIKCRSCEKFMEVCVLERAYSQ